MTMVETPTVRVREGSGSMVTPAALEALNGAPLIDFLLARRWFGAKGGRPTDARFRDVIPLPWDGDRMAITTVDVELGADRRERYQVPLSYMPAAVLATGATPKAILARVDGGGVIVDAVEDPRFLEGLCATVARGGSFPGDGAKWSFEPLGDATSRLADQGPRVGSAEQSNTSIIFGDRAIMKLFRRLESGENPDVEIGRFLTTQTSFRGTPALLGVAKLETGSGASVSAILQTFVARSTDAWKYALDSATADFARPAKDAAAPAFIEDARTLGSITREMHEALASDPSSPEFAPERATPVDVRRWVDGARRSIDEGLLLLEQRMSGGFLPAESAAVAHVLLRRRAEFPRLLEEIEAGVRSDPGARIRHHGDYHLGQVLRTPDGEFKVIDFEGEPARSLAERRAKHCPLRDVAGMLRSFAYAAASAATDVAGKVDKSLTEVRAGRWQRDVRKAFLAGYVARPAGTPGFLPANRAAVTHLISLFEIEKVFYELKYELNNRPDWVWIPLRGIARLTEAGPSGDA